MIEIAQHARRARPEDAARLHRRSGLACRPLAELRVGVWFLFALLLGAALPAVTVDPAPSLYPAGSLQGRWEGQGPGGDCFVTISGDSLYFEAREDFWYDTAFTIPASATPPQLYATILRESSPESKDVGRVVVALYKIEGKTLTLGVVEDMDKPPAEPLTTDWEWVADIYTLEKVDRVEVE